jgi:Cu/Zn superoxide dismutase
MFIQRMMARGTTPEVSVSATTPPAATGGATTAPATAPAPAGTTPAPVVGQAASAVQAVLAPQANSGVSGQATLSQTGDTTTVTVTLSGMAPNSAHAGHIHNGACSGPILFPLATIRADSAGQGSGTATVNAPLDLANWWVQYHASDNPPGAPIACGQPGR